LRPAILLPAEAPNIYLATRLYVAMGISVLPCNGKKPAVNWTALQKRLPLEPTIDLWHKTGLLENVGVICGDVSGGLVVIDLDGEQAVETFSAQYPRLLDTYAVASGSGTGMHLYYYVRQVPPTTRVTGLTIGNIELRSNGSYVVAPPSIHPNGKPYKVHYTADILRLQTLTPVVEWIKSLIREKHGGQMPPPSNHKPVQHSPAYGMAALRGEAAEVARATPGERNARLYRAALKMGSLIADSKIDRASVEQELLAAASQLSNDDGEAATRRTIASGINRGLESSRANHRS